MVRLGRMETMSREVQAWHMDRVAEQRMAATGDVAAAAGMPGIQPQRQPHSQLEDAWHCLLRVVECFASGLSKDAVEDCSLAAPAVCRLNDLSCSGGPLGQGVVPQLEDEVCFSCLHCSVTA